VQKPHEPHVAFVHCAKPHVAPCGFRLPINYCRTFRFGLYGKIVARLVAVVMCLLLNVDCVLPWDAS
jgi:hypothetical protein